ncbi:MAG: TetR/AcrR family transcriptional regulator [Clostridia bacterium]|nr:TetR/AcrR family transcriptional regulator [Clostridia bacterium]
MNKSESKYFNTAIRMDEALLALLEKKDFEYITIREICETAQVNRSTFYLHYENTCDLLNETLTYLNGKFSGYFQQNDEETLRKLHSGILSDLIFVTPEYLVPYLTFIRDNRRLFLAALTRPQAYRAAANYSRLNELLFTPILDRFSLPEPDRKYTLSFYIHGIMGVISEWIRGGCETDIGRVSQLITGLILSERRISAFESAKDL